LVGCDEKDGGRCSCEAVRMSEEVTVAAAGAPRLRFELRQAQL
jgi:hypothetical protein